VNQSAITVTLLLSLLLSTAEAADWRLLAKDAPLQDGVVGDLYYDKESIARPFKSTGSDKSVIAVWVRYVFKNGKEIKNFEHLSCQQRQVTLKSTIVDGRYVYDAPFLNRPFGIEPSTTDERLYNILCK
jgi:hypothetical protein